MRHPAAVVTLILAAFLPSCGDSPTGPIVPPEPEPGVTFRPSAQPVPPESLALQVQSSTLEEITLVLRATEVEDLYGWAVDLVFDPEILSLASFQQGDFLEPPAPDSDIDLITQLVEDPEGRLVIGQTRIGDVDGVTGTGDVLVLVFQAVEAAEGSTTLEPEDGASFDSDGTDLQLEILGGTVTVVR